MVPFLISFTLQENSSVVENFNFIWKKSEKVPKIAYNEIVNSDVIGELGLLEIGAMCNSLLVSQYF